MSTEDLKAGNKVVFKKERQFNDNSDKELYFIKGFTLDSILWNSGEIIISNGKLDRTVHESCVELATQDQIKRGAY